MQLYVPNLDARFNFAISIAVGFVVVIDGHWVGAKDELTQLLASGPLSSVKFNFYEGDYYDLITNDPNSPDQVPHEFVASSHWIMQDKTLTLLQFELLMSALDLHLLPFWGIQFHAYGSPCAVNQVMENATAFAYRSALWSIQVAANFKDEDSAKAQEGFERWV